jgi:hypothetical protein
MRKKNSTVPYSNIHSLLVLLGRVAIIAYGGYGPRPASKTDQIFVVLISRPSSCVRPESVQICFGAF